MAEKILGLIPTRGGSKGLEGKNIRILNGKPMLAYTIEAARQAPQVNRVLVSTDNEAIAEVAQEFGADVYRHPDELSYDGRPTFPVIRHVVQQLAAEGEEYDVIVTMRATSPLRIAHDINEALAMLEETGADSVVSVVADETGHPIRLKYLDQNRRIIPLEKGEEHSPVTRQSLPVVYRRNGAIYATRSGVVLGGSLFGPDSRGYVMPKRRSVNVNDEDDFMIAEALLKLTNGNL